MESLFLVAEYVEIGVDARPVSILVELRLFCFVSCGYLE